MLKVFGLVFYCSPKEHLGGRDGHGASWFVSQEEVSNIRHGPPGLSWGWRADVCCWNPSLVTDIH